MTPQEFDANVTKKYCSTPSGLTLKGFKEYFKDEVKEKGKETVFQWLLKLGYDEELILHF